MRRSPSTAPQGNKTETGGSMPIRFILNGEVCVEDSVSPSMTVLDYLRERRGLTGRPFYYFPYGACVSEVAIGEPPLFPALSAWLAIRDAISSLSDHRFATALNTPATAERILDAVEDMGARAGIYTHV